MSWARCLVLLCLNWTILAQSPISRPVKIGLFDTGCRRSKHLKPVGIHRLASVEPAILIHPHGTWNLAMLISTHPLCPGLSPAAEVHCFEILDSKMRIIPHSMERSVSKALELQLDIVNFSVGWYKLKEEDEIRRQIQRLLDRGVVVVASAGHNGLLGPRDVLDDPAEVPGVVSVGAMDDRGVECPWSARTHDGRPDFLAKGANITLLGLLGDHCEAHHKGTSHSAVFVTAMLANQFPSRASDVDISLAKGLVRRRRLRSALAPTEEAAKDEL